MALISCPKCGQLVSSSAKVCSNCGCDIGGLEKISKDFMCIFNDALQRIANLPIDKLVDLLVKSELVVCKYLQSRYDRKTAAEIFVSFVAMCLASDGRLSYDEYELLSNKLIPGFDGFSYEDCANLVQYYLNNDVNVIDEVIAKSTDNVKEAIARLCVAIAAIDGTITVDEKQMCFKYFVLAF